MRTEKQLQDYLKKEAAAAGVLFFKMKAEGKNGFPDVMLAYCGRVMFLELKSPSHTGRLRPAQARTLHALRNQMLTAYHIASAEEADNAVTYITRP